MSSNKYSPNISWDLVRKIAFFQGLSSMRHLGGYKSQYDRYTYDCISTLHLEFHNLAAYKNIPFSKMFQTI